MESFGDFLKGTVVVLLVAFVGALFVMGVINSVFTPAALTLAFGVSSLGYWKAYSIFLFFGMFSQL